MPDMSLLLTWLACPLVEKGIWQHGLLGNLSLVRVGPHEKTLVVTPSE